MKLTLFIAACCSALLFSSCTTTVNADGTVTQSATAKFLTGTGGTILTSGAVEALTYKAIKSQPKSEQTFKDMADILSTVTEDKVLTPDEVRTLLKANLKGVGAEYRTYAMLALDLAFAAWESTSDTQDISLEQYNRIINAIILGIDEGIALYDNEVAE